MRLFLAINLPDELKIELGKLVSGLDFPGIKKVSPENLHITLKFLGDVDDKQAENIKQKLLEIKAEELKITLGNVSFFPNEKNPRVIWIGINEGQEEIIELERQIDSKLSGLGFKAEKEDFKPHLTIARIKFIKDKCKLLEAANCIKIGKGFDDKSFDLMASALRPEGPEYKILHQFSLADRD